MVYWRSFFPMFPTLSRSSIRGPMLLILCACSLAAAAGQDLKEPLEEPLADLKPPTMLADASDAMGTEPGAATEGKRTTTRSAQAPVPTSMPTWVSTWAKNSRAAH